MQRKTTLKFQRDKHKKLVSVYKHISEAEMVAVLAMRGLYVPEKSLSCA